MRITQGCERMLRCVVGQGRCMGGDLSQRLVTLPANFPTGFLRKPTGQLANSNYVITECLATSFKCERVAKHPDHYRKSTNGRATDSQNATDWLRTTCSG